MPGIVGLITKMPRDRALLELHRMVKAICHESFYETGTWIDESLGVYVGWAERKNSFASGMPLLNERRDVVLVFSGEEFPKPDTARHLKELGHEFETSGASYLVHLYEEDGAFPVGLNGRFHGLLVDRRRGTVTLFNDRYGMHRIYHHESKEAFYFAAEAKAILAVRPELRMTDPKGLGEFIACGCVLENRTLFTGIHVLPAAAAWVFQNSTIDHRGSYFHPREWENQEAFDAETYYWHMREIFSRNLGRYFNCQEQIGMSLTGGLDTRMIMAWHKASPGMLPCYSFGGMYRDCQDVRLARRVARACRQPHEVIPIGQDFLSRFPHYAERAVYLTDGCVNVSRGSDLYANEHAAKIAPVRMTGNYGSEILRRGLAFKPAEPRSGLFQPEILAHALEAKNIYTKLVGGHALSFIAFCQAPWHHYGLLALEQTQLTLRSPYLDNELVQAAFRAPNSDKVGNDIFTDDDHSLRLITDGDPGLRRIPTDRGLGGTSGRLSATLARGWREFSFKAEYAYDYGMPQSLARIDNVFSRCHLERLFLGRHKFNHFRIWYRDTLSEYVREILLDRKTLSRPYLERKGIENMVRRHVEGTGNYTSEIHSVLTLELVHRLFVDSPDMTASPPSQAETPIAYQ